MTKIVSVVGREILDSRGNPTVEAEVELDGGVIGLAAVPSGASTGEKEAVELRDGDGTRYGGKGVKKAASHISKELAAAVVGHDATNQRAIDQAMIDADATPNKGNSGPMRFSPCRWPPPEPRHKPTACRCTVTWAAQILPSFPCRA